MPYVSEESRRMLPVRGYPVGAGELNYVLTQVCLEYMLRNKESYQVHNDIIGALNACALEWYRRIVVPYENAKAEENGDVFYDIDHPEYIGPDKPFEPVEVGPETRKQRKARKRAEIAHGHTHE